MMLAQLKHASLAWAIFLSIRSESYNADALMLQQTEVRTTLFTRANVPDAGELTKTWIPQKFCMPLRKLPLPSAQALSRAPLHSYEQSIIYLCAQDSSACTACIVSKLLAFRALLFQAHQLHAPSAFASLKTLVKVFGAHDMPHIQPLSSSMTGWHDILKMPSPSMA